MVARKWLSVAATGTSVVVLVAVGHLGVARAQPSPYLLPWESGPNHQHTILQGNYESNVLGTCTSGCSTHSEYSMRDAYDFAMPEGTEVLAARGGRVRLFSGNWSPDHCGGLLPMRDAPVGYIASPNIGNEANFVEIDHGDGTSALYLHLSQVSESVERKAKTGEPVARGEVLGRTGRTGFTKCLPHLHFQVQNTVQADWFTQSIPVRFGDRDVRARTVGGMPAEGRSYISDNVLLAPSH